MEDERFSTKKFFDFSPVAIWTTLGLGLKVLIIALIIFGGMTAWEHFFGSTENVNMPTINVGEGGTSSYTVVQNNQRKRFFIPFVEVGVGIEEDSEMNWDLRAGLRFEF